MSSAIHAVLYSSITDLWHPGPGITTGAGGRGMGTGISKDRDMDGAKEGSEWKERGRIIDLDMKHAVPKQHLLHLHVLAECEVETLEA